MEPDFYDPFESFPDVDDSETLIVSESFYANVITTEIETLSNGT